METGTIDILIIGNTHTLATIPLRRPLINHSECYGVNGGFDSSLYNNVTLLGKRIEFKHSVCFHIANYLFLSFHAWIMVGNSQNSLLKSMWVHISGCSLHTQYA